MSMKMVFLFKALSPEDEKFERDYELVYDSTLLDFHNMIVEDLGFDPNEMASFFTSDKNWAKLQEFTSENMSYGEEDSDMDELTPMAMEDIALGQIIHSKHERLLYVFDLLSNRGLYIELIKTFKDEEDDYPKVSISRGVAPIQINEDNVGDEVSEMFDDMYEEDSFEDEFGEFSEGGGYEEESYNNSNEYY